MVGYGARRLVFFLLLSAVVGSATVLANEPPDAEVNPVTTSIEAVDVVTDANGTLQIRHSVDPGQGAPTVHVQLTGGSQPNRSPRIAILDDGIPAVTWWREGTSADTVLFRRRDAAGGAWETEAAANESGTSARNPEIVSDGTDFWIVFEVDEAGGGTSIEVRRIDEAPDPWTAWIATSSFSGDLDTLIHFDAGDLWVTWVDSGIEVGWSEYDPVEDSWSAAAYESYATDTVDDARTRIRSTVTGN